MSYRVRSAAERRAEIQARATAMGIDEGFISTLVDTFYERVRADAHLGPIFAGAIEDWDEHLPKMKAFWSSVALNTGKYNGRPVPAHTKLTNVEPDDFQAWLSLFKQTLTDIAPSTEAIGYFMERAERIAKSLQFAMFSLPSLNTDIHT